MMKIQSKGIANKSAKGEMLDVFFSYIEFEDKQIINNIPDLKNSYQEIIEINWSHKDLDREIESVSDAYLKLHLLSHKLVLPNSINLDGLFSNLPNIVWTNQGSISIEEIENKLNESKINKNDLLGAIKRVSIFSNRSTHQVALNLSSEKCEVTTEDPERSSKAKESVFATYQGEDIRIGYNAEYLKDIVSHVSSEEITIKLGSPVTAALFVSSENQENEENTMLLMPIRLNN